MSRLWSSAYALTRSVVLRSGAPSLPWLNIGNCLVVIRGASPLGLPHTLSRAPLRRRAPFAWLARALHRSVNFSNTIRPTLVIEHRHQLYAPPNQRALPDARSLLVLGNRCADGIPESHHEELPTVVAALPADEAIGLFTRRVDVDDSRQTIQQSQRVA